jgi:hypothetical protein
VQCEKYGAADDSNPDHDSRNERPQRFSCRRRGRHRAWVGWKRGFAQMRSQRSEKPLAIRNGRLKGAPAGIDKVSPLWT